ncbi:MAG: helicase-related protein, partial [Mycobacterium sp.]
VATDIAARGIHVDDVSLVVHADPPVEHKAYLHRSGRTARAGNDGTVVTLMVDDQVSDVRVLTRKAGIKPTITKFSGTSHPVLQEIAPGERKFTGPIELAGAEPAATRAPQQPGRQQSQRRRPTRAGGTGGGRSGGSAASSGGGNRSRRGGAGQHR